MRAPLLSALLLLPACHNPEPAPITPAAVVIAAPPPAVTTAAPSADPAPPPPAPLPRCEVDPLPDFAVPKSPGACVAVPPNRAASARAKLTKRYTPTSAHAKLAVTFGCDPLVGAPSEIVFEYGSGHGQNLALVRLRRRGDTFEALRLQRPPYHMHATSSFAIERATLLASKLDALLPAARAFVLAKLKEQIPATDTDRSGFFSSGDFHALLRVEDAAGHVIERAFTGYPTSEDQLASMPMSEIDELLYPLMNELHWEPAPLDDDARAFFVRRYLAAGLEPPSGRAAWWVRERFVMMAESAGTRALIPSLVALANARGDDASTVRTREEAVQSLAALSGVDLRKDARGAARPIEEAAADYARACKRAP